MRNKLIYLLLVAYMLLQLSPLVTVLADTLAHTFHSKLHLATVHFENGHYHLHTELKTIENTSKEKNTTKPTSEKTNSITAYHLLNQTHFTYKTNANLVSFPLSTAPAECNGFTQLPYLPPQTV
jgi:hypothetical protein